MTRKGNSLITGTAFNVARTVHVRPLWITYFLPQHPEERGGWGGGGGGGGGGGVHAFSTGLHLDIRDRFVCVCVCVSVSVCW